MILLLRATALVLAAAWAFPLFAVIDLVTALSWRAGWDETIVLEASWGALFTFFMVLPLVLVVLRPARYAEAGCFSLVTAVSLVAAAVFTADPATLLLAAAALVTGAAVVAIGLGARRAGLPRPGRPRFQPSWASAALAVVGVPLWGIYVVNAVAAAAEGEPRSISLGLDHWPVQAAAGIAVVLASLLGAFVVQVRVLGISASALTASVIGVTMALSQGLPVATESPVWSVGAVLWGAVSALAMSAAPFTRPMPEGKGAAQPGSRTHEEALPLASDVTSG
ncbi:hypothetical protein [Agromyces bauzanensis]